MRYGYTLRMFEDESKFFGPGAAALLELVEEHGSLRAAAGQMGMAYSKAWRILRNAESVLGFPLLESRTGGRGGGGAVVSAPAHRFLERYRTFERRLREQADALFAELFSQEERET
ncbi:MAG: LysR family transcriptional regulator [Clostridia bacterium]|nr:LysR family transcriptional regulator [Clostridia bacterium]